ncbi:MAG: hypothetical protein ACRD2J_03700 [Thermoanaerobaculia bacterium]
MEAQTLTFRPHRRSIDVESIVEQKAEALSRTIVRMAVEGRDGDLCETLRSTDHRKTGAAIEEIVCLYLFIADRSAHALLDDEIVSPYHRDAFVALLFERSADLIAASFEVERIIEARARLTALWEDRRAAYGACSRMYRQESESLDGTVIYLFYQNILRLGRETALHVLAALEIPLLHVEMSKVLGEMICDLLGMEM